MSSCIRRALLLTLAGAAFATAAETPAHAGYNIWTGEYTIGQPEIQARIDTHFPLGFRYAQLFDVQVLHPRLTLSALTRRAAVTVDVVVRSPFAAEPLTGALTISSKLRFDTQSRSVRLTEPDADHIEMQGLAPADALQLQAIGQVVAQEALRDYPVHTFKPAELTYGNRTFEPGEISVVDGAITVKLN